MDGDFVFESALEIMEQFLALHVEVALEFFLASIIGVVELPDSRQGGRSYSQCFSLANPQHRMGPCPQERNDVAVFL